MKNLKDVDNNPTGGTAKEQNDFDSMPLDELSDYIVRTYHQYAEEHIQVLRPDIEKICESDGAQHPELFRIKDIFHEASGDIARHQKKEEIMLFPFIKKMTKAKEAQENLRSLPAKAIEDRVKMLTEEHDSQEEAFRKIALLTKDYTASENASESYKQTLNLLKDFQTNLHQHIHLENDILFPKALQLLKELIP